MKTDLMCITLVMNNSLFNSVQDLFIVDICTVTASLQLDDLLVLLPYNHYYPWLQYLFLFC